MNGSKIGYGLQTAASALCRWTGKPVFWCAEKALNCAIGIAGATYILSKADTLSYAYRGIALFDPITGAGFSSVCDMALASIVGIGLVALPAKGLSIVGDKIRPPSKAEQVATRHHLTPMR